MDKKFGLYLFAGLLVGAAFGVFLGVAINNSLFGIWLGAAGGLFIGWFIAAAVQQNSKK